MYDVKFVSKSNDVFLFGVDGGNVFDIEGMDGNGVDLQTSQGFGQIGETVEVQSVKSKTLKVKGRIYKDFANTKRRMQRIFAPFQSGYLVFDKVYMYVVVKSAPTISPVASNGSFMMQLLAPFPFWRSVEEETQSIGKITPSFQFPVNYKTPHYFGKKSAQKYINIVNNGDLSAPFGLSITATAPAKNITVTNLTTREFLKLNGTLETGNTITIARNEQNQLTAKMQTQRGEEDIIGWIDDDSTLERLYVGDNLIHATDDSGGDSLTVYVNFSTVYGGVYED